MVYEENTEDGLHFRLPRAELLPNPSTLTSDLSTNFTAQMFLPKVSNGPHNNPEYQFELSILLSTVEPPRLYP